MRKEGNYWVKEPGEDWWICRWTGTMWFDVSTYVDFHSDDEFQAGTLIDEVPIERGLPSENITTITEEDVANREKRRNEEHRKMMESYNPKSKYDDSK